MLAVHGNVLEVYSTYCTLVVRRRVLAWIQGADIVALKPIACGASAYLP